MTNDSVVRPNLAESDLLVNQLFEEVKKREGMLSDDTELKAGAAAINRLLQTKLTFGDPTDNFAALTPAVIEEAGLTLSPIRKQQMETTHNFYYLTLPVNFLPEPGTQLKSMRCLLNFGPPDDQAPIVQTIFPQPEWKEVLDWGGSLSLGLDGDLDWRAGVDASQLPEIANLSAGLKAKVVNKNELNSFIIVPDYQFQLGRFEIAAYGDGGNECFWDIQKPDLQATLTVKFGVVFKVPKGAEAIELQGTAWVEPKVSWLTDNIENVFARLADKLKTLLLGEDENADKFARGVDKHWQLSLPKGAGA